LAAPVELHGRGDIVRRCCPRAERGKKNASQGARARGNSLHPYPRAWRPHPSAVIVRGMDPLRTDVGEEAPSRFYTFACRGGALPGPASFARTPTLPGRNSRASTPAREGLKPA